MENKGEKINLIVKTTSLAMHIVSEYIAPGDIVVDCTMGNGYDTFSLASAVGCLPGSEKAGEVYSFDIQTDALEATGDLLAQNGISDPEEHGIHLIHDSHTEIDRYLGDLRGKISAFVFNLGFMPGRDKTVMTTEETSITAIKKAINLVKKDGVVSVMAYSGHREGEIECQAVYELLQTLPSKKYHVAYVNMINQKKTAPSLFLITPKTDDRKPL